jgi:5-formyltetrahydrofolate cyclo-ligase
MHEFATDLVPPVNRPEPSSGDWSDVRTWRKSLRAALLAERAALPIEERRRRARRAIERLLAEIDLRAFATLGFYWPIRAEIDLRNVASRHIEAGGSVALPVVRQKNAPVEFWRWQPQARMQRGFWNIPVPARRDVLQPDALLIPLVGFDAQRFRLGYGGGYYDRTLAAANPRPVCIGIGHADAELATIHPQPHDIPMNIVVTDRRVYRARPPPD